MNNKSNFDNNLKKNLNIHLKPSSLPRKKIWTKIINEIQKSEKPSRYKLIKAYHLKPALATAIILLFVSCTGSLYQKYSATKTINQYLNSTIYQIDFSDLETQNNNYILY